MSALYCDGLCVRIEQIVIENRITIKTYIIIKKSFFSACISSFFFYLIYLHLLSNYLPLLRHAFVTEIEYQPF